MDENRGAGVLDFLRARDTSALVFLGLLALLLLTILYLVLFRGGESTTDTAISGDQTTVAEPATSTPFPTVPPAPTPTPVVLPTAIPTASPTPELTTTEDLIDGADNADSIVDDDAEASADGTDSATAGTDTSSSADTGSSSGTSGSTAQTGTSAATAPAAAAATATPDVSPTAIPPTPRPVPTPCTTDSFGFCYDPTAPETPTPVIPTFTPDPDYVAPDPSSASVSSACAADTGLGTGAFVSVGVANTSDETIEYVVTVNGLIVLPVANAATGTSLGGQSETTEGTVVDATYGGTAVEVLDVTNGVTLGTGIVATGC